MTTEARVVNVATEPFDVYIGRGGRGPNGRRLKPSLWGNPHRISGSLTRSQAIVRFEIYAVGMLSLAPRWLEDLRGKVLGCHCKPEACHGDVIVDFLRRGEVIDGRWVFTKEAIHG